MEDRREFDDKGRIDEIVASGGAHLERLDKRQWFLELVNGDGSSTAIWIEGKIANFEDRGPRPSPPKA
jgi:hypothetical protein